MRFSGGVNMNGNCGECDLRWDCKIDPAECDNLPEPVTMTRADKIRAMTDDELAYFLNQWGTATRAWQKYYGETLYWLQQPEEVDHEDKA